ncbi:hypothetical protein [Parabacteroides goldsteinii]
MPLITWVTPAVLRIYIATYTTDKATFTT